MNERIAIHTQDDFLTVRDINFPGISGLRNIDGGIEIIDPPKPKDPKDPTGGRRRSVGSDNKDKPPTDDIDRLADLLKNMYSQPLTFPSSTNEPVVIPTQTQSSSIIPILLIAGGLGFIAYEFYKRKRAE